MQEVQREALLRRVDLQIMEPAANVSVQTLSFGAAEQLTPVTFREGEKLRLVVVSVAGFTGSENVTVRVVLFVGAMLSIVGPVVSVVE